MTTSMYWYRHYFLVLMGSNASAVALLPVLASQYLTPI